ncbi:MAG: family 43 glycosylhydrolase, partial [Clostridia bacterium]|nr:family 43 glycosylhydrolase [Clostridia bacterium]
MKKIIPLILAIIMITACVGCVETTSPSSSLNVPSTSSSSSSESSSSMQIVSSSSVSSSSSAEEPIIEEDLEVIDASSSTLTSTQQAEVDKLFYQNDLNTVSADPACVYCEDDGYFYMYGTGHTNFNCYRSRDLTSWEKLNNAFKQPKDMNYSEVSSIMTETEFNNYKNNTWLKYAYDWAPGVIYDKDLDLYLMFFSAKFNPEADSPTTPMKLQLTLATSKTPYGPFIQWTGRVNGQNGKAGVNTITYANGQTVPAYD